MPTMTSPSVRLRRQSVGVCLFAALTVLLCGALITAAILSLIHI